jgi:hypothetical protein
MQFLQDGKGGLDTGDFFDMLRIIFSCFLLASTSPVWSHDQWADGSSVPAWVKSKCCGVSDAHHLRPEQVHQVAGGYLVDGHVGVIPLSQTDPSQDGEYWIFGVRVWTDNAETIGQVHCFFVPLGY